MASFGQQLRKSHGNTGMTKEDLAQVNKSKHVKPERVPDIAWHSQTLDWQSAERLNLHAVAWSAVAHGKPATAIPATIRAFLRSQADALSDIGTVRLACGDYESAARSQQEALELYEVLGDRLGEANALTHLGTVQQMNGAHDEAKASLDRAVVLYKGLGDASGEAEALNNLGELALRTAEHSRARELHERALAIATRIAAAREQARAHEGIGRSYLAEGQAELGETSVCLAVQIYQQMGSPHATRAAKLLRCRGR